MKSTLIGMIYMLSPAHVIFAAASVNQSKKSTPTTSMQATFNEFFSGKLEEDAVKKLDGEILLRRIIQNMYGPTNDVKNAEYPAILNALKDQNIINLQTERMNIEYSEDYSVTFDKIIGYDFVDLLTGPKKLSDYFKKYYKHYKTEQDIDEDLSS